MSALGSIKQQLLGAGVFKRTQGAAQMAAAMERRQFTDTGYVMLAKAEASANELVNATEQRVTSTWSVFWWTSSAGDNTGDVMLDAVEAKRDAIIAALLGFEPEGEDGPLSYLGGELAEFAPGAVLSRESFSSAHYLRAMS